MIQATNIEKSYGKQVVFSKADFTLGPGERVGLVGRNGHGKTTLLHMILGHEQPDAGTISVPRDYRTGHLSQHIGFTADTVLNEARLNLPASENGTDETFKAETVLMGLGFSADELGIDPKELSGGFQVRLSLAKMLVSDPNILLLDEPTNHLDIVALRWLTRFLRSWQKELIIITHDRSFMDSITTHTMAIHRCSIRKVKGPTEKVYQLLLREEELFEKIRIRNEKMRRETEQFINRFRAKATKARAVQSRIKSLQKEDRLEKLSEIRNLEFSFAAAPFTGRNLMEVTDLSFGYNSHGPLLIEGLSFYVEKHDRIGIVGRNGKGKTTLLNLLAGELSPLGGKVRRHRDLKLACFGQTNINRLNPQKTVEEEIMDAHPDHSRRASRTLCGAMMFPGDQALKKISVLSGGERSRVLLGKLLVSPANMLLLDEPTNHLDMDSTESLVEAVHDFAGAVIIVTHSEMILNALATRLIVFDQGKVTLFHGTYEDFLDRVGWNNEVSPGDPGGKGPGQAKQPSDRKSLRRERAELIQDKSRTLGMLRKRIERTESEIMRLEQLNNEHNSGLLEASEKGDGEGIKRYSKALHESRGEIEELFSQLELLYTEFDAKSKEFEEKLNKVPDA
jgi:ATP-binding cassette subfamily F protein 3